MDRSDYIRMLKAKVISFSNIPNKYKDEEFCLEAVKINGYILMYLPQNVINLNMCIEAVRNNSKSIRYVPEKFYSEVKKACRIGLGDDNNGNTKQDDSERINIKELMEDVLPGVDKQYGLHDYHSHDNGSLYDQFEYIKDNDDAW